ncbi:Acyl carrier protein-like [Plasmopara halstedii]|uniref:Acyl carrier protein-like n=1 Tax=Plasmopara halstedii TaxID=4781 RepID=A0A0P1ARN8_PLAHL|nr:Acyl carrier protein-like [Plasmopara halstedii]CEG44021.1 Acyl carrier protein-like [Plasmopara halstedii]|eukprot:XP_024580390.1 Acyl carrier protein-like [Plasmopara halstedii]
MENPLQPPILPKTGGLRKSNSTRNLASLVDVQTHLNEENQVLQRRKSLSKPPRHASVPMYAQILLQLWQRELNRNDVDISSDFFYDLNGTKDQVAQLVGRMQALGFNITVSQFLAMHRCSIYALLVAAL